MKALGCSVLLVLWACCGAEGKACDYPEIENGSLSDWHYGYFRNLYFPMTKGIKIFYKCDKGYAPKSGLGSSIITCTDQGWTPAPRCHQILCYYETVVNGEMLPRRDKYTLDDTVDLNCHPGFVALYSKDIKRTCTIKGWVPPLQCESVACDYPEIENGRLSHWYYRYHENHSFPMAKGRQIEYECRSGYATESADVCGRIKCTDEGWSPTPRCHKILCYYETVVNGEMLPRRDNYTLDDTVDLNCHPGFVALYSKDIKRTCTIKGWVPPLQCESKTCDYPEIENGKLSSWSYRYFRIYFFPMTNGREIYYECDRGNVTESGHGSSTIACTDEGWTPAPRCRTPPICSGPPSVPHGKVVGDVKNEYSFNSSIEYICDEGYVLRGARMLTCFNGEWSRDVPQCIRLCQVTEDKLKEHFVELSLKQRDKMAFFEGDKITFTCISGFQVRAPPGILVANCSKAGFIYPTCFNLSSCILEQKELDQKNIKLLPGFANLQYATNGQVIEFSCKEGYIKHTRSSDLSQICEEGFIAYPICIRART